MFILYHCFGNEEMQQPKQTKLRNFAARLVSYTINAVANTYQYNGIISFSASIKSTKGHTAKRQVAYDLVFFIENAVLAAFGYALDIDSYDAKNYILHGATVAYIVGIILKLVYYKFLHLWSDLIEIPSVSCPRWCHKGDVEDSQDKESPIRTTLMSGDIEMTCTN